MQIIALVYISQSELQTADPKFTQQYCLENKEELHRTLQGLGMDINMPIDEQELTHRNRFGNVVTCLRWVGNELTTPEWIASGYASEAAIDKSRNSKLTIDLYRLKGLAE